MICDIPLSGALGVLLGYCAVCGIRLACRVSFVVVGLTDLEHPSPLGKAGGLIEAPTKLGFTACGLLFFLFLFVSSFRNPPIRTPLSASLPIARR